MTAAEEQRMIANYKNNITAKPSAKHQKKMKKLAKEMVQAFK